MKKQLLILTMFTIIGCSNSATAQSPNWLWAKSASATEHDGGVIVATDVFGNVFITGSFNSPTITFGTTTLTNAGGNDIFIVKYDALGNVLWAMSAGGAGDERGNSVSTDSGGNVFMTGFFASPAITFGTTILPNAGGFYPYDIFIVKFDTGGNVLWAKRAGGSGDERGNSVSTDTSGNVFMAGYFTSPTITFGTITLTNISTPSTIGPSDIFIVKYDENGNVLWATNGGSPSDEQGNSVSTDAGGNVFITGWFSGSDIIFGTDTLLNAGVLTFYNYDIFIVKYDAGGNVLWANSAGGTGTDDVKSVATDDSGNVFMTGYFGSPTITFGTTTLTNASANSGDIFIVKYDVGGNVLWAKSAGGAYIENGTSVSTDASGNVFMTGYFESPTITFGTTTLTRTGFFSDIFIVKYDAGGNVLWAKSEGGIDIDGGNSISTNATGNVFMTGFFHSPSITFGTTTLINAGFPGTTYDIFIAKLDGTTGIENIESANGISLFPNPATDLFTINYPDLGNKDATISIMDITGKVIYKSTITSEILEVNTSDFAEGVYLVQIQTENFIETKKVIVSK